MPAVKGKMCGMTPENWTIRDKIFQFGGIAKLHIRDKSMSIECETRNKNENSETIQQLQKDVKNYRRQLQEHMHGDMRTIENILSQNRILKLAYSRYPMDVILENLEQVAFKRRKELDKLRYIRNNRAEELKLLLLDRNTLMNKKSIKRVLKNHRQKEQVLLKKIHLAQLQFHTSASLNATYKTLLDVLKKDSVYFDTVLANLQKDSSDQVNCIYRAVTMGQIAMEDFGNIKHKYEGLEKVTFGAIMERDKAVRVLQKEVNNLLVICRKLTRCDSRDIMEDRSDSDTMVWPEELRKLEKYISTIESLTHTSSYTDIFYRLQLQMNQRVHLLNLLETNTAICEDLAHEREETLDQVRKLKQVFFNTHEEQELLDSIKAEKRRLSEAKETISLRTKTIGYIHFGLHMIYDTLVNNVKFSDTSASLVGAGKDSMTYAAAPTGDAMDLLVKLREQIALLVKGSEADLDPIDLLTANSIFSQRTQYKFSMAEYSAEDQFTFPILEEFQLTDPKVPTRAIIKKRNAEMAEEFSKPPIILKVKRLSKFKARLGRATKWL